MINKLEILKRVDWDILNEYIENNLIVINKHPEHDIWILNYSPKAMYNKIWDLYTLSCRGLIIDTEGNILARPFQKFKNIEEHDPSEIDMLLSYNIYEKIDGSIIICFYYEPAMTWIVASRGSFISEQSMEARKILNEKNIYDELLEESTYIFEIIYPENKIVVDYGDRRELVLLAVIDTKSGLELNYYDMVDLYSKYFTVVKKYDIKNLKNLNELKELEEDNKEGFVVRFSNGFRVKVKFQEYIRLHGILSNVSNITVWEHLKDNYEFDELLNRVPDEFYQKIQNEIKLQQNEYNEIERNSLLEFVRIYHINQITERAQFAEHAKSSKYCSILFNLYNRKEYSNIIWKMIKPKYSKFF